MTILRNPGSPKAALHEMFRQCATPDVSDGYEVAGAFLDRDPFHLRKCTHPDGERDLSFKHVSMVTGQFRVTAAAEHLCARAGGLYVPLPDEGESELSSLTAEALMEMAEAVKSVMQAECLTSEGGATKTLPELRNILAQINDVLRVAGRARAVTQGLIEQLEAAPAASAAPIPMRRRAEG